MFKKPKQYQDEQPCEHKGCLSHISHPCEGCGRIGGVNVEERLINSILANSGDVFAQASFKILGWRKQLREKDNEQQG